MTEAHAIRFERTGDAQVLEWQPVELGTPGNNEVLLRQTAVGLNFIDVYHRTGQYPVQLPSGLGLEAAGVVERASATGSSIWVRATASPIAGGRSALMLRTGSSGPTWWCGCPTR